MLEASLGSSRYSGIFRISTTSVATRGSDLVSRFADYSHVGDRDECSYMTVQARRSAGSISAILAISSSLQTKRPERIVKCS